LKEKEDVEKRAQTKYEKLESDLVAEQNQRAQERK